MNKKKFGNMLTLVDLQTIIGSRILKTLEDDLTPEQRQIENEQSALVMGLAKQMINNGDLILRTEKLLAQNRNLTKSVAYRLIEGEDYEKSE